ncbi:MAG: flagellar biosynthesis anti-sigma factor FlgM [Candidatus Dactylopiibacterium sp.]|nr:flagellar biosynthesis anti-sigma factor FlgM [Candidatus Dactylopiibacterium sp.]
MKIDNSSMKSAGLTGETKTRASREAPTGAQSSEQGSDVKLSALSSNLQKLEAAMANTPVVDSGKVAEIKTAISQGQFRVDAGKVADGLLASVRQMLNAQAQSA